MEEMRNACKVFLKKPERKRPLEILRHTNWRIGLILKQKLRIIYKIFVGKFQWKRPLGRPKHRWEDNI
jgi:hypothetical protein